MVFILQMISNIGHSSYSHDLNTPTIVGATVNSTLLSQSHNRAPHFFGDVLLLTLSYH